MRRCKYAWEAGTHSVWTDEVVQLTCALPVGSWLSRRCVCFFVMTRSNQSLKLQEGTIDWYCSYYFVRNSLVALLKAVCATRWSSAWNRRDSISGCFHGLSSRDFWWEPIAAAEKHGVYVWRGSLLLPYMVSSLGVTSHIPLSRMSISRHILPTVGRPVINSQR